MLSRIAPLAVAAEAAAELSFRTSWREFGWFF
jgi:hypothetical protein